MSAATEASEAFSGRVGRGPSPRSNKSFLPARTRAELAKMRQIGAERQRQNREEWSKLDLKQDWMDRKFMIANARSAGIRILPPATEPCTPKRLERYLRRMRYGKTRFRRAVWMTTETWCKRNPRAPLWAAVCLAAESLRG